MEMSKRHINGLYLVIDPSVEQTILLDKVQQALEGGVGILQIWNHWPEEMDPSAKEQLIASILETAREYEVPVFINEEWELLKTTQLNGVHFEAIPDNFKQVKAEIDRDFLAGITCSNDLEIVKWAEENELDYISFCALFPSPSVDSCEIVRPETVQKARELTGLPLFLSGGITPKNIGQLGELDFNGVAVISGILKAEKPLQSALAYKRALNKKDISK